MYKYFFSLFFVGLVFASCSKQSRDTQVVATCVPSPGAPCPPPTPMPKYTWTIDKPILPVKIGESGYINLNFEADSPLPKDVYISFNVDSGVAGSIIVNTLKIPKGTEIRTFPVKVFVVKNSRLGTYKVQTSYASFDVTILLPRAAQFRQDSYWQKEIIDAESDSSNNIYILTAERSRITHAEKAVIFKADRTKTITKLGVMDGYGQSLTISNNDPVIATCIYPIPPLSGGCTITKLKPDGSKVWEYNLPYYPSDKVDKRIMMGTKSNNNIVIAFNQVDPATTDYFEAVHILELDANTGAKTAENIYYVDEINRKHPNPAVKRMYFNQVDLLIDSSDNIYLVGNNFVEAKDEYAYDSRIGSIYVLKVDHAGSTKIWQCGALMVPDSCPFGFTSPYNPLLTNTRWVNNAAIDKTNGDLYLIADHLPGIHITLDSSLNLKSSDRREISTGTDTRKWESTYSSIFDPIKKQLYWTGDIPYFMAPSCICPALGRVDSNLNNPSFQPFLGNTAGAAGIVRSFSKILMSNHQLVAVGLSEGSVAELDPKTDMEWWTMDLLVYWPIPGVDF